jgi:effector-binding domain-containing protein/DNA-binding transcriptional MerR regulator
MLSIGEFSKVSSLPIKTLRYYHEIGILEPDEIDDFTGYRYYGDKAFQQAESIKTLKDLGFTLNEIKDILKNCNDDGDTVKYLQEKLTEADKQIEEYKKMKEKLNQFIKYSNGRKDKHIVGDYEVEKKKVGDIRYCSIRHKGKYSDFGKYIGILCRKVARNAKGPVFSLYYDCEYKEEGADIEVCIGVKKDVDKEGINCGILEGGKAISLIHKGPYESLSYSYKKIFEYARENGMEIDLPIREFYVKGPGMIFRGNPNNYLTEIVFMIKA